MTKKSHSTTVSLVLGSGGARGLAHIGVIHWLEENGYQIRSISGSSMGALIGGIYAAGKLDIYTKWVCALSKRDVLQLLDFAFDLSGLFSGERIMQKLRQMLGDIAIEDLPVSYTAVATDLDSEREVWITEGSLFEAIRASIAIPTVFTPVRHQGRLLVDGGVLNPIPIAPTLKDVTDATIAVSLSGKEEKLTVGKTEVTHVKPEKVAPYRQAVRDYIEGIQARFLEKRSSRPEGESTMFEVMSRSIDSMQNTIARFKLAAYKPDCLIEIPSNACSMFEFYRAEELINLGYARAERELGKK